MSIAMHRPRLHRFTSSTGRRPLGRRARRLGLTIFFVSIAVNAALGIYAVLAPHFGETQGKVLGTSLCITGAVLLALACEPAWERRALGPIPVAAAALGTIGFAFAIVLIWASPESETWAKVMMTIFTLSIAGVAASLLALARLAPRHAWVFTATLALLSLGAAMYAVVPWLNEPGEWYVRSLGVVMIALAAFVVTVPVLHWVDRGALAVAGAAIGEVRFCPHCGRQLSGDVRVDLTCMGCGRSFRVDPSEREGKSVVNLT
jgi:hypothetical protein